MNGTTTTTTKNEKLPSCSAFESLIADGHVVRLKCNCRDDGFVVASLLRGLLDGRTQNVWSSHIAEYGSTG